MVLWSRTCDKYSHKHVCIYKIYNLYISVSCLFIVYKLKLKVVVVVVLLFYVHGKHIGDNGNHRSDVIGWPRG